MRCYLIRNSASLGVLGLFWAEDSEQLWWLVDQANGDPTQYEYAELTGGFLAFTGEAEPVADQIDRNEGLQNHFNWSDAEPSEALLTALHQQSQNTWNRLPHADEPGGGLHGLGRGNPKSTPGDDR